MSKNVLKKWILMILIFSGGLFAGYLIEKSFIVKKAPMNDQVREGGYQFINPLLFCDISSNKEFDELLPLKNKMQELVDNNIKRGKAKNISLYFRTIDKGHWTGINEYQKFSPASLLKIPLMIAYLKTSGSHPEILLKKILYKGDFDENQPKSIKQLRAIKANESYSVEELIAYMILYSDNNALRLLDQNIDINSRNEVYTDLGLPIPNEDASVDFMSAKSYSYFFRALYNASYLNKYLSEKALELLSKSDFPRGIRNGVPKNILTAVKFGERTVSDMNGNILNRELHDCGIIYYPNNPYLLCIMTSGDSFDDLGNVIRDISSLIYKEVDNGILR